MPLDLDARLRLQSAIGETSDKLKLFQIQMKV
jgi:hypothetical protein